MTSSEFNGAVGIPDSDLGAEFNAMATGHPNCMTASEFNGAVGVSDSGLGAEFNARVLLESC